MKIKNKEQKLRGGEHGLSSSDLIALITKSSGNATSWGRPSPQNTDEGGLSPRGNSKDDRKQKRRRLRLQPPRLEEGATRGQLKVQLDPSSVCASDPCGNVASCHPTPSGDLPFACYCPDKTKVKPGEKCPVRNIDVTPSAISFPLPNEAPPPAHARKLFWVGAVFLGALLIFVVFALLFWRRRTIVSFITYKKRKTHRKEDLQTASKDPPFLFNLASNPNYYAEQPDANLYSSLSVLLIDKEQIIFTGELGEGCFGKVYKGEYGPRCFEEELSEGAPPEEQQRRVVAVKVLKEIAGVEAKSDFLREVEIMSTFRHENILSLVGIVLTENGGTPSMVFEYMPHGDLAEVLRSSNAQFYSGTSNVSDLKKEDLLHFSVQIASGMSYLSSQHFVHRDLACRNCLVGENLNVKISDFGMSRDVYTCDYYKVGGSRMLPVRWMAPESIIYGKFTLESDVWSFGVVLWEIFSYGKQPYYGNSNEEVVKLILQGILLTPPETCLPPICEVLRRCWATEPHNRLRFPEIHLLLMDIQSKYLASCLEEVTYSEVRIQEDVGLQLDSEQYLLPKFPEYRHYLALLSD